MRLAFNFSSRKEHEIYVEPKHNDIHFHLEAGDSVYVGNSFDATVVVRSESEETREILVNLTAIMSFYTGVSAKKLKSYKLKFPLKSQEGKKKKKRVSCSCHCFSSIFRLAAQNHINEFCPEMLK